MNNNLTAADWAAARGAKWLAQLSLMEAMLSSIDEPLIGALELDAPCRIADIGCGGGGTTLEIMRRAPAGSIVHGFDISPAAIQSARDRIGPDQRAIAFTVADASTAPAPDVLYDRLFSRFGIMFFDDPFAAFANVVRWLAPSGRVAFAVWGRLADNPWMTSVKDAVAEVVDVPASDPDTPGPFRYAEADTLLTLLVRTGLTGLDVRDWRGALPIGGGLPAAAAASFALASFSSFSELLANAGDTAPDDAHRSLTARFSRHLHDGAVRLDACVHIITGTRMGSDQMAAAN